MAKGQRRAGGELDLTQVSAAVSVARSGSRVADDNAEPAPVRAVDAYPGKTKLITRCGLKTGRRRGDCAGKYKPVYFGHGKTEVQLSDLMAEQVEEILQDKMLGATLV